MSRFLTRSLLAVVLLTAGCGGGAAADGPATVDPSAPTATIPGDPVADWTTYHGDAGRTGYRPTGPTGTPALAWHADLDGAVYGQPLVVGGQVLAATENDSIYGLELATGKVRWRAHVGTPVAQSTLPCGNIDPLGITGTPVYDPDSGLVFAVAETTGYHHLFVGVDAKTGAVKVNRDIPTPDGQPRVNQQRAALLLAKGRVYVAFGGLAGDCGPYVGSVVGVPTSGTGPMISYRVPTGREGGIWQPAGPVLGAHDTIYVSVGNGDATDASDPYDGTDSVLALGTDLHRTGYYAPTTWAEDNAGDQDLGSMAPAVLPDNRVFIAGKRGTGYLLRADNLGGLGHEITQQDVCRAFGGPAYQGGTLYVPCGDGGPAAVSLTNDKIKVRWRGPTDADGSPVLTPNTMWIPSTSRGILYAVDTRTGTTLHQVALGTALPHFASPTLAGGTVLLGTTHGIVAVASR
jgi:outer membrane protein assembly factor BamB